MLSTLSLGFIGLISFTKGDLTIHHCSFTEVLESRPDGPEWYHEFTSDDECTNGLPSGNCVAGFKTTRPICDSRYAIVPGTSLVAGPGGTEVMGPGAYFNMGCEFGFDPNTANILYEMDFLCDSSEDTSWRTLCASSLRPPNIVCTQRNDTIFTIDVEFTADDCDNGLPTINDYGTLASKIGECAQFTQDRLIPGPDYGHYAFNPNDDRFPGMQYLTGLFRGNPPGFARTGIAYVCDVNKLISLVESGSTDPLVDDSSDSDSGSGSDSSDEDEKEFRIYTCSVPDGNSGEILNNFSNGNEINDDTIEYVYYKFKNDDCIDNEGNHGKPPNVNDDASCVINIRSERDCGIEPIADFNTRESFNKGETDEQTGKKGPGILYTRPTGIGCNNEVTIMEVDYLCYQNKD